MFPDDAVSIGTTHWDPEPGTPSTWVKDRKLTVTTQYQFQAVSLHHPPLRMLPSSHPCQYHLPQASSPNPPSFEHEDHRFHCIPSLQVLLHLFVTMLQDTPSFHSPFVPHLQRSQVPFTPRYPLPLAHPSSIFIQIFSGSQINNSIFPSQLLFYTNTSTVNNHFYSPSSFSPPTPPY